MAQDDNSDDDWQPTLDASDFGKSEAIKVWATGFENLTDEHLQALGLTRRIK